MDGGYNICDGNGGPVLYTAVAMEARNHMAAALVELMNREVSKKD